MSEPKLVPPSAFVAESSAREAEERAAQRVAAEEWLRRTVADTLERLVRPLLLEFETEAYKLTLLARMPGNAEADVVVTEDDRYGIEEILCRRLPAARLLTMRWAIVTGAAPLCVCPCCNRTFSALSRHMKTKHPDLGAGA